MNADTVIFLFSAVEKVGLMMMIKEHCVLTVQLAFGNFFNAKASLHKSFPLGILVKFVMI